MRETSPRIIYFSSQQTCQVQCGTPTLDLSLGLGKPNQDFVFGSVWVQTEYSPREPKRETLGSVCITNFSVIFFGEIQDTVVKGTKDRNKVFLILPVSSG